MRRNMASRQHRGVGGWPLVGVAAAAWLAVVCSAFSTTLQTQGAGTFVFNASLPGKRTYRLDAHRSMTLTRQIFTVEPQTGVVRLRNPFLCGSVLLFRNVVTIYVESRQQVGLDDIDEQVDYVTFPLKVTFLNKQCVLFNKLKGLPVAAAVSEAVPEPSIVSVALTRSGEPEENEFCFRRSQLVLSLSNLLPASVQRGNNCTCIFSQPDDPRFKVELVASDLVSASDLCIHEDTWRVVVPFKIRCPHHSEHINKNINNNNNNNNAYYYDDAHEMLSIVFHPRGVDDFDNKMQRHKAMRRLRRHSSNRPPYFESSHYVVNIPEEKDKGLVVTTVTATDPNQDSLTYAMQAFMDTRSQNMFKIDTHSGLVTTTVKLDREFMEMHVFRITAADHGNPPLTATTTLQMNVVDENDHSPTFEQTTYETTIRESVSTGSTIVTVRARDQDSGANADILYSIINPQGPNEAFRIDSRSGIITTRLPLDREVTDQYKLVIQATDQGQLADRKSATATVLVTVLDDNDNYPQFSEKTYTVNIPENIDWTTSPIIATINATDSDIGSNGVVRYSIIGGNTQGHFNIDTSTGQLSVISSLDYEGVRSYRLVIRAQDGGSPARSNTTQVLVNVLDVNDNEPRFYTPVFHESVTENVPVGTSIVRVQAYDADDGKNAEITYTIKDAPPDMPIGIDSATGWITTIREVDREEKELYNFVVEAKDNGEPPQSSVATVTIAVQDTNDNDPIFEPKTYEAVVSENDSPGTPVISVTATDADENPRITYQITSGNMRGRFSINSQQGQGVITISQPLDYKMERRFVLSVTASDAGGRSDVATVYINVSDANTHRPMFEPTPYSVTVLEDAPIGTTVLVVSASDGDVGENARITYSMDEVSEFQINPTNGAIVTAKLLDRESKAGYTISVTAQDHGIPPLSDATDVEITVLDVNDNLPVFTESGYIGHVREDALIGTSILQISASDEDQGLNGRVRYTFMGGNDGNGFFNIDPTSGIIRTDRLLDRETIPQYHLMAYAVDRGTPALSSAVNITVSVEDVNDNPPRFESDRIKLFIQENSPIGSTVGEIRAVDPDEGSNADILYSIAGGADAGAFSLTSRGGAAELMTRTELDYESPKKKFDVVIRAASPPLQNEVNVEVWVQDVNDNAPVLRDFRIIFNNFKNHFPTNSIGRVPAFDADVSDNLTYRFIVGNKANLLLLNSSSGEITLSPSLNTNVPIQAALEVSVSDGINEVRAECQLAVLLVTDAMLFNSVTVRLDDMTQEAFLSPLFNLFTEGLAAIIPCPKENIFIFNVLDDTDVEARILNVSFSAKRADLPGDVYYSPEYLMERVYLNRAILAKLATVKVLPFDDNLCVREPCPYYEDCVSVLKFGNASGFIASNSILFRPIYPVNTFACDCPPGFTGMRKHYLCDTEVNLCYSNPCGVNGSCIPHEGGYTCVCNEGFTGKHCEVNVNDGRCAPGVCRGGSSCARLIKGGFICENCSLPTPFRTNLCELKARRFVSGSFLTFPALRQRHRLTIRLSFATRRRTGLLLYNGRYSEKHDFIALEIVDGRLQFSFSLGTEVSRVTASIPDGVHDGKWHTVHVKYFNRTATLSIDNCDTTVAVKFGERLGNYQCANATTQLLDPRCADPTVTCHRFLDLTGPLQLGGLPSLPSSFQVVTIPDFEGCIKEFYVDHQFVDLNSHVADNGTTAGCPEKLSFCDLRPCKNGGTCVEGWGQFLCYCPSGFGGRDCSEDLKLDLDFGTEPVKQFNGQSFLVFHTNLRSIRLPWITSMSFRTRQPDALLMRIQVGQTGEAVLELINGYLRYRVNTEWLVLDQTTVNDGRWHNVQVKWTTEGVRFIFDYGHYEKIGEFETQVQGQYMGKVTVGGIESAEPSNAPLNFKGCVQDVRIGNRNNTWLRPTAESNIEEGCIAPDACASHACPPNSKCTNNWGTSGCKCLAGFMGMHCVDICHLNPCSNGGTCRRTQNSRGYICLCNLQHAGEHCEIDVDQPCPTNWYGSPICGPCQCNVNKGYDPDCNKTSGECYCKENHYRALNSDTCNDCSCYLTGSFSKKCDPVSGQCKCRSGVIGRRCDSCSNPFAEVTLRGCEVIYDACPRSFSSGMWWERTYFGEKAIQSCPHGLQGKAERMCDRDAGWQEAVLFNCTSGAFRDLRDLLSKLDNKQLALNTYLTVKISQDLEAATGSTSDLHGDDLLVVVRLLSHVLSYEVTQEGLNLTHRQDKDFVQNIVESASRILDSKYKMYWEQMAELPGGGAHLLLHNFEQYSKILVRSQGDTFTRPFEVSTPNILFGLDTISSSEIKATSPVKSSHAKTAPPAYLDFSFPGELQPSVALPKYNNYLRNKTYTAKSTALILPLSVLGVAPKPPIFTGKFTSGESSKRNAVVSYIIYHTLGNFIPRYYDADVRQRWGTGLVITSPIVTVNIYTSNGTLTGSLPKPIRVKYEILRRSNQANPQCVYWKSDASGQGRWSSHGCELQITNERHVYTNTTTINCTCSHLTSFAVLQDITDEEFSVKETLAESIVTYAGVGGSLVLLLLAFLVFCMLRGLQTNSNTIHKNLAVCIFIAELIFLIALKMRGTLVHKEFPCKVVAIFLHYFYLCEFAWMFLEAIHLYRMLTEMRDINHGQMRFYYSLGYGVPAIVVGLAVGVRADEYGNHVFCWLSIYESVVWSLVGPVCVIVVLNLCVFVLAIRASLQMKDEVEDFGNLRMLLWLGIALLPLLGATWILAMLSVNENIDVLYYFFSIFTLCQGLYIFLGYCIFNKKVRLQIVRTCARCTGKKVPFDEGVTGPHSTVAAKRSALAYHNTSFDVLHRNIGISTSSTTSRSTCKTSSSPYRSDSHLRNTSTSTPSNFNSSSDLHSNILKSHFNYGRARHKVDDPDTGEANRKRLDSDSDSDASLDHASLDLASSHSSDEEDFSGSNSKQWEAKKGNNEPNIPVHTPFSPNIRSQPTHTMNILSQPPYMSHWSSQGPPSLPPFNPNQNYEHQVTQATSPMWQQSERLSVNTASDNELPQPDDPDYIEQSFSRFSPPMIDDSPESELPVPLRADSLPSAGNDAASDYSSRASSKLAAILSGQRMYVPPMTMATDSEEEGE